MTRSETIRGHLQAIRPPFAGDPPESGLYRWRTRLGRWPFEVQVDRYALELRCYLADELFCTGRIWDAEADGLIEPAPGPGDAAALAALAAFVDAEVGADTRRFLKPPHADRHPDRRADSRQQATILPKPERRVDLPG